MEWFPPPALTYLVVCGQGLIQEKLKQARFGVNNGHTVKERLSLVDSPNHGLYLLPVRWVDLVTIFWSHQHGSKAEGRILQSSTVTFNNGRRQDGNNIYKQRNGISSGHFLNSSDI